MQKIRLQCPLKFFASSSKCGCLTASIVLFFPCFGRLKRNFESSLICFLCVFFLICFPCFFLLQKQEDILVIQLNRNMLTLLQLDLDQCTIQYCLISFLVAPNCS
uniref:(northern house mosquito) hypothetical protein n=1 Tax=Culex pipiens TaxID=7175 RepID=A0A8D8PFK3_CULPI